MQLKTVFCDTSMQRNRAFLGALLVAVAVAIALPLINYLFIYPAFTDVISSAIQEDAQRISKYILPASLKHSELTTERLNSDFFADIYKLEHDFELMKIKVFSAKGEVIYSTEPTDIGHLNTKKFFRKFIVRGLPYTKLINKNTKTLDGETVTIDMVETYIPFMSGDRFLGAFELYYDITKRKERMEHLVHYSTAGMILLSACLMTAVVVLLRMESARKDAQEKNNILREDMERITQHDLKSPLTGLLSGLEYLEKYTVLDKEQASIASDMRQTANRGMDTINRSLDLYKMETCRYQYTPTSVDILRVSFQAASDLAALANQKDISVLITKTGRLASENDTVYALAEEPLYYSLIANLLKNAVEASPKSEQVTINLTANTDVIIFVHNHGTVPEELRKNFFDKYTTSGKRTGSGLGTYSAKLMTQTMGGTISMTTSQKDGTGITVTLPASTPKETG
ncbi:MAG: HAMP domain-containing histidine kinase [Pseudodesulfovibrio sp.]|nr:HAMP domain-containing histidine kinase [Pseudodesulfovibrio sp.]